MTRILYLHGFASGPSSRKAVFFRERLEACGGRVEILDLAAGDFEHLTIGGQLAVVEQAAAGEPVSLVGSSMGGYLAALYAARHHEVQRAALLAPAFGFARRWADSLGAASVAEWRRKGFMEVFHYGDGCQRRLGYRLLEDAANYEDYPDVQQPTLIFHGSHDDVVPAQSSRVFAASRPSVHLEILDSGHDLLNALDRMAPKIASFLLPGAIT
jgi:alpha-beta hydrolase superfamily lysophospholipase